MKRLCVMSVAIIVFLSFQVANAAVVFQNLGTAPPPATLGTFAVSSFNQAAQAANPDFTLLSTIPGSPIPGNLTTSFNVTKVTVPVGWGSWSHGYTGVVYDAGFDATTITLTLPPNTGAFYLYAEPGNVGVFTMTATTNTGTTSGNIGVNGSGGANGFGFYTTAAGESILTIVVTADAAAIGFALGEFGIAQTILFTPEIIPTMTECGIIISVLSLGFMSVWFLRKKRFTA